MAEPFPSLESLRGAHVDLMRRWREADGAAKPVSAVQEFVHQGQATGVFLADDNDRWAAQSMLDYWSTVLFREHVDLGDVTVAEFDPEQAPQLDNAACPYVGLASFGEPNAPAFFGREGLVGKLLKQVITQRFVFVLGSSGSGKSSLVRAGLLPKLRAGVLGTTAWDIRPPFSPGSNPLEGLCRALRPADASPEWVSAQADKLAANPAAILEMLPADPLLVMVDQFEEAFTLTKDDARRNAFFECLQQIATVPGAAHSVVATMRTDFETQLVKVAALQPYYPDALRVLPLNAAELREAIEKPAAMIGLKFEDGLVDELISQILGEPAGLPLLQFTLLQLWNRRSRNRITWATYKELGSAREALGRCADEFYRGLIVEKQKTVERVLLRIVMPGAGREVTSRRVTLESLYGLEARDRVQEVVGAMVAARLLKITHGDTPADDQVEVSHEALIRNWPRLTEWVEEKRREIERRQWLTDRAERWRKLGDEEGRLLRGNDLADAQKLDPAELTEVERNFIAASDNAQAAWFRRRSRFQTALKTALAVCVVLLVVSIYFNVAANRNQKRAQTRMLATLSERLRALHRDELSALMARQAYFKDMDTGRTALYAVDHALRQILSQPYLGKVLHEDTGATALSYCPESALLAEAFPDRTEINDVRAKVRVWPNDDKKGDKPPQPRMFAFKPDCSKLAVGLDDGIHIWDLKQSAPSPKALPGLSSAATCLAVSADDRVAACWGGASLLLWPSTAGGTPRQLAIPSGVKSTAAAFSRGGKLLAAGYLDGTVAILADGAVKPELSQLGAAIQGLAFDDRDSQLVAAAGLKISLLDVESGAVADQAAEADDPKVLHVLPAVMAVYGSNSSSGTPLTIAVGDLQGTMWVWNKQHGAAPVRLPESEGTALFAGFGPNGVLYSGSASVSLRQWTPLRQPVVLSESGSDYGATFSADTRRLAVVRKDRYVEVLDVGESVARSLGQLELGGVAQALALSGNGNFVAATSYDHTFQVWRIVDSLKKQEPVIPKQNLSDEPSPVALDEKGERVAVYAGPGKGIQIWQVQPLQLLRSVEEARNVDLMALRPDGLEITWLEGLHTVRRKRLDRNDAKALVILTSAENVRQLAYSADGSALAIAEDHAAWYVKDDGKPVELPRLDRRPKLSGVTVSPHGEYVAVSEEESALVWQSGDLRHEAIMLPRSDSFVQTLAFRPHADPDKWQLLVSGNERTVMWDSTKRLAESVCGLVGRSILDEEWRLWAPGTSREKDCGN